VVAVVVLIQITPQLEEQQAGVVLVVLSITQLLLLLPEQVT
jgi:hypothetical protein